MGKNRGNFSCYAAGLWTLLIQNGLYKRKLRFSYLTELMKLYNVYDFNYAIRKSALHFDIHIFHFIQIVFLYKCEQHIWNCQLLTEKRIYRICLFLFRIYR